MLRKTTITSNNASHSPTKRRKREREWCFVGSSVAVVVLAETIVRSGMAWPHQTNDENRLDAGT